MCFARLLESRNYGGERALIMRMPRSSRAVVPVKDCVFKIQTGLQFEMEQTMGSVIFIFHLGWR